MIASVVLGIAVGIPAGYYLGMHRLKPQIIRCYEKPGAESPGFYICVPDDREMPIQ